MRCANCLHENRPKAYFCDNCGSTLEKTCAHCGTVNRPAANFCDHCGRAFSSDPAPALSTSDQIPTEFARKLADARDRGTMVGERRVVTMLFCDVVGSTAAAERLDPEEWTEIINGAFEHMIAPVYRYEGTLARLMGDAILAFFGAPIAHEDDPQRAILAGLDIIREITPYWQKIKDRWGIEANVRVGINTGLVVVGAVGSDLKMEYSALGDAINLAARMEQTATPGTVQVSEHTYRLTTPVFDWEPLGALPLKGKEEPVHTYRPLRRRSDPGRLRGIEGLHTPLVGRGAEMAALEERLQALETGRGGVVFVLGEAGLGKSRLVREACESWRSAAPDRGRPPAWIEKRVSSYDTAQAYNLIRRILRTLSGIEETASPEQVRSRLAAWTAGLDLPEKAREELHEVAGRLLIEDSPQPGRPGTDQDGFQARLFEAIGQFFLHRHARTPGVIFIDDLHWADSASLDLLHHLASLTEKAALLFIYTARPEWDTPAREFMNRLSAALPHRIKEISLAPLGEADEEALLRALLPNTSLPKQFKQIVRTKADGNPFFIEEIVRECIEGGLVRQVDGGWQVDGDLEEGIVPDSLEALLSARIDRLNPAAKQVLQLASVLGRSFSYRPLARISGLGEALDPALEELLRSQMLEETARLPERDYLFRQALTQETAYRSILRRKRQEFHRRAGEALETLYHDRLASQASILAFHFEEAGEAARAVRYHRMAGENAFALYASVEAAEHFGSAITLAGKDPAFEREEIKALYLRKGRAHELASHFSRAMQTYQEMERWGAELEDREIVLAAVVSQAVLRATPTDLFDAGIGAPLLERALRLAREVGDPEAEAKALWARMILLRLSGRIAEAAQSGLRGLEIAEAQDLTERVAYLYHDLGYVYAETGRLEESSDAFRRSGLLWQQLGNLPLLADGLVGDILNMMMRGEFEQAIANASQAYEISLKIHNIWGQSFSKMYLGTVYRELGRYGEALEAAESSIRDGREAGFAFPKPLCTAQKFYIFDDLGDEITAKQLAAELWEITSEHQVSDIRSLALIAHLRVLIQQGELEEAEDYIWQPEVQAAADEKLLYVFSGNEVINLYLQTDRAEKALERCLEKQALADRFGLKVVYPDLNLIQAQILREMGRTDEARTALLEALEQSRALGKKRVTWQVLGALADLLDSEAHETSGTRRQSASPAVKQPERPPGEGDLPIAREPAPSPASLRAEARKILEEILTHIPESLQPKFLARPDVRAIWADG